MPMIPDHPNRTAHRSPRRSRRGLWTVVGMFALGSAVLAGLFLAPRAKSPPVPAGPAWGAPPAPLRFVVYDGKGVDLNIVATDLHTRAADADYLLILGLEQDQVIQLAAALGMRDSFDPRLYQQHRAPGGVDGLCILSKHPLYAAQQIRRGEKQPVGVSAVSVVGGRKFWVACAIADGPAEMERVVYAWSNAGRPPGVIGGRIGPAARAPATTTAEVPAARFVPVSGSPGVGPALLATPDWRPRSAETRPAETTARCAAVTLAPHAASVGGTQESK